MKKLLVLLVFVWCCAPFRLTASAQCTGQFGPSTFCGNNGTTPGLAAPVPYIDIYPTPTRAGDVIYWNGAAWVTLPGNNSGTKALQEGATGVPIWATVPGLGTVTSFTCNGGTTTITTSGACAGRQVLAGTSPGQNTYIYYVNGSTGNNSNPGTSGSPWASCQYGMDWLASNVDANQQNIVLQVNDVSQCTGATLNFKAIVGIYDFWPNGGLLLCGGLNGTAYPKGCPDGSNSGLVTYNCGSTICMHTLGVSGWRVQGFAFDTSGAALEGEAYGRLYIGTNSFTGNPGYEIECIYNAFCEIVGNLTILDTAETSFMLCEYSSLCIGTGTSVTLNSGITLTNGFFSITGNSTLVLNSTTFLGTGATASTGNAALVNYNSTLFYGNCAHYGSQGNSLYIPGNAPWTGSTTGGQCEL